MATDKRTIISSKDLSIGDTFRVFKIVRKDTRYGEKVIIETSNNRDIYLPPRMYAKLRIIIDGARKIPPNLMMECVGPVNELENASVLYKFYIKKTTADAETMNTGD